MIADVRASSIVQLLAEPARASMCAALLGGEALTPGELACAAKVVPSTATGHLARMTSDGVVSVAQQVLPRLGRAPAPPRRPTRRRTARPPGIGTRRNPPTRNQGHQDHQPQSRLRHQNIQDPAETVVKRTCQPKQHVRQKTRRLDSLDARLEAASGAADDTRRGGPSPLPRVPAGFLPKLSTVRCLSTDRGFSRVVRTCVR